MVFEASSKIDTHLNNQRELAAQTSAQASTTSPAMTVSSAKDADFSSLDEFRGSDVEDNDRKDKIKSKKNSKAKVKETIKQNSTTESSTQVIANDKAQTKEVAKSKVEVVDCEVQVEDNLESRDVQQDTENTNTSALALDKKLSSNSNEDLAGNSGKISKNKRRRNNKKLKE